MACPRRIIPASASLVQLDNLPDKFSMLDAKDSYCSDDVENLMIMINASLISRLNFTHKTNRIYGFPFYETK